MVWDCLTDLGNELMEFLRAFPKRQNSTSLLNRIIPFKETHYLHMYAAPCGPGVADKPQQVEYAVGSHLWPRVDSSTASTASFHGAADELLGLGPVFVKSL